MRNSGERRKRLVKLFVILWFTPKCIALTSSGLGCFGGCCHLIMMISCMTDLPATWWRLMEGTASKHSRSDALGN